MSCTYLNKKLSITSLGRFRFYVVHSYIKEEDVQVSVQPICLDTYDFDRGVYTISLYSGQYF